MTYTEQLREALKEIAELSDEWDSITHNEITQIARTALSLKEPEASTDLRAKELEDFFEDCFDNNTRTTGGGYEADYTDKWGVWKQFEPKLLTYLAGASSNPEVREENKKLKQGLIDIMDNTSADRWARDWAHTVLNSL